MAVAIKMPKMSDTMTEGVVRKWNFKVGDTIKSGDILAEVETDKATMDLENYEKGTILHFAINEGDAVPVDGIIAIVGNAGEDFQLYYQRHLLQQQRAGSPNLRHGHPTETAVILESRIRGKVPRKSVVFRQVADLPTSGHGPGRVPQHGCRAGA